MIITCVNCGRPIKSIPEEEALKNNEPNIACQDCVTLLNSKEKFLLKDSGSREQYDTGAVRDIRKGKGRYDLIPPTLLRRLAKLYESGAIKYSDWNWSKGIKNSRCMDSALRHINQYREGYREEDHLVQAIFNLAAIVHNLEMIDRELLPKDIDDLPIFLKEDK